MSAKENITALKDSLDARTRLMQDVAHELKNPLSVIHGYLSMLSKENLTKEEMRKSLRTMLVNTERILSLVEHLQDATRLETNGFDVETRTVSGAALIQEAVESAELEATRRGVRLSWRSPVQDPVNVIADPKRVAQILTNLISNALKFTPSGGLIDVHAQRLDDEIRFSVIDNGPGISSDFLPRLFDRFYQTPDNPLRPHGLGLGLAIAKSLVEAQKGRIWVESNPGKGAQFHFTLPAATVPTRSKP